jgi:hypothetical protein
MNGKARSEYSLTPKIEIAIFSAARNPIGATWA